MDTSKALLAVVAVAASVAAMNGASARAASDDILEHRAPRWFDETVYRPDCPGGECSRDRHADGSCVVALRCR